MEKNEKLDTPYWALRITYGAVPFLAGLDKFLNLLTDWHKYLSPSIAGALPISPTLFLHLVGVIEMVVGIAVLTRMTRIGSYVATVWLVGIALNLLAAGYLDIAVRDVAMAVGAFTLAKLEEARATSRVGYHPSLHHAGAA